MRAEIKKNDGDFEKVAIHNIDKTGVTYSSSKETEPHLLKWEEEGWAIKDIVHEIPKVSKVVGYLIRILADDHGVTNLNNETFKKEVCREAGLSSEEYDDAVNCTQLTMGFEPYDDITDQLEMEMDVFGIEADDPALDVIKTKALGKYLKELDEADEDRSSGDPRRALTAKSGVDCLEDAVDTALEEMGFAAPIRD